MRDWFRGLTRVADVVAIQLSFGRWIDQEGRRPRPTYQSMW
ncbi:hypothetical protein ACFPYM_13590 [Methylobacterium hispanicum]|nr:hypothetical protein [Methylobacterium hispanicum]